MRTAFRYTNFGNADGFVWRTQGTMNDNGVSTRLAAETFVSADHRHHVLTASAKGKAWCTANGYTSSGTLGWVDPAPLPPPPSPGPPSLEWSFGVSGEVESVPSGFRQRSVIVYSTNGINAAVDVFGATLRAGYNTSKADAEDVFLQTMTVCGQTSIDKSLDLIF